MGDWMRQKRRQVVTISGELGSGKSTVARVLADRLGWLYYSTGMAQRTIANEMGITTIELNKLAITNRSIDEKIDAVFKNPPWGNKPCIVDSRLAFYFLPNSFKVCLTVDPLVAAKRIFHDKTRSGESKYKTIKQAMEAREKRRELELKHFIKNYKLDIENQYNFDLVIDTSLLNVEQVCDIILSHISVK